MQIGLIALQMSHGASYLLKAQKLDDRERHSRVEPQTTLVGAQGTVELHTIATIDLNKDRT